MADEKDRENLQSKATDLVKKVLTVGVGAIFLTEESLRSMVSDFKLPKELLTGVLESANKTKSDFLEKLSSDVMDRLKSQVNARELVQEILEKNEIEFNIKVKFRAKSAATAGSSDGS